MILAGLGAWVTMHVPTAASAANVGTQRHFAQRVAGRDRKMVRADGRGARPRIQGGDGRRPRIPGHQGRRASWRRLASTVRGYDPEASANAGRSAPWIEVVETVRGSRQGGARRGHRHRMARVPGRRLGALRELMPRR